MLKGNIVKWLTGKLLAAKGVPAIIVTILVAVGVTQADAELLGAAAGVVLRLFGL